MMQRKKKSVPPPPELQCIDPLYLTPDQIDMVIYLYKHYQAAQRKRPVTVRIKPSGKMIKHRYLFNMPSPLYQDTALRVHIEFNRKMVISPPITLSPKKLTQQEKIFLKYLLNSYPQNNILPALDPITHQPYLYLVSMPHPKNPNVALFQLIHLTQTLVRYPRKKLSEEYRYAICGKKPYAIGAKGLTYLSKRTISFVGESQNIKDVAIKDKDKEEKWRIIKLLHLPRDVEGDINFLDNSPRIDRSVQNKLMETECGFLQRNSFFHAKHTIKSNDNNSPAIIMHLAPGNELRNYIAIERDFFRIFNVDQRIDLTIMIADEILKLVHGEDIIHRDLKPENIILETDVHNNPVKATIVDFGLSRDSHDNGNLQRCGTKEYLAPEVISHLRADELSDSYSFATMLRIDLWNNINHGKYNELSAEHKVRILAAIIRGIEESPCGRASLLEIVEVFRRIRRERKELAESDQLIFDEELSSETSHSPFLM